MPEHLVWFKWESYATWLSGAALLMVVYWIGGELYLLDPTKAELALWQGILISAASIGIGWLLYDFLCKSRLGDHPTAMMLVLFAIIVAMSWGLNQVFTGRAALLHLGAFTATRSQSMSLQSPNFGFLSAHDELLVKYAARAERSVFDDPNGSLVKLRQFGEALAALAAGHHGLALPREASQHDVLRALTARSAFNDTVRDYFHQLRKLGNDAVHNHLDDPRKALHALKMARILAVWFHRSYGLARDFKPGPFVPPPRPEDASDALSTELDAMEQALAEANLRVDAALESAQAAEARRKEAEAYAAQSYGEVAAALELAAESEAMLEAERERLQATIDALTKSVAASTPSEQIATAARSLEVASTLELDEADTRLRIDAQLRAAGWEADTAAIRHAAGVRPQKNRNVAIAEWPTATGPADYVLFRGLTPIAVVEAKRDAKNVSASIVQAERYSRGFGADEGVELAGPWGEFEVPFVFATNGRPYLKQLEHKSGIHFRDVRRASNLSRPLNGWYTPDDLAAELAKPDENPERAPVEQQFAGTLRAYQQEAVAAVEAAIDAGQRNLLLAMATGTGKTRTAICMAYRLLQSKRFRRVLFLVDRSALGEQAANSFGDLKLEQQQTFTQIYDVKGLGDQVPEPETKLHIATVQGMVHRVVNPSEGDPEVPVSWYDCVIIDECHRGYNLDRELSETELTFRTKPTTSRSTGGSWSTSTRCASGSRRRRRCTPRRSSASRSTSTGTVEP